MWPCVIKVSCFSSRRKVSVAGLPLQAGPPHNTPGGQMKTSTEPSWSDKATDTGIFLGSDITHQFQRNLGGKRSSGCNRDRAPVSVHVPRKKRLLMPQYSDFKSPISSYLSSSVMVSYESRATIRKTFLHTDVWKSPQTFPMVPQLLPLDHWIQSEGSVRQRRPGRGLERVQDAQPSRLCWYRQPSSLWGGYYGRRLGKEKVRGRFFFFLPKELVIMPHPALLSSTRWLFYAAAGTSKYLFAPIGVFF